MASMPPCGGSFVVYWRFLPGSILLVLVSALGNVLEELFRYEGEVLC